MASNASNARPPRIGLTTYGERARWGVWDRRAAVLPISYVDAVATAGGVPVLLPPVEVEGAASAAVAAIDALLLTGGADVDPATYGARVDPATRGIRPDRDRWEQALLAAALDADLPVLAICRGVQLLDVAMGGTLHQHVPDVVGHANHGPDDDSYGTTHVKVEPGSRLANIIGDTAEVPCHHHQSVDRVADGLVVCATADDGIVEAVESPDRSFVLGVQWHPEDAADPRLFVALVEAARPA